MPLTEAAVAALRKRLGEARVRVDELALRRE